MILSKDFKIFPKILTENRAENNLTMSFTDGRRSASQNLIENPTENLFENQHQSLQLSSFYTEC